MTFLMRLSEYRAGAERLVESHVFANLSALEVLDAGSVLGSESRDGDGDDTSHHFIIAHSQDWFNSSRGLPSYGN
jgi:hypothetical protein